MFDAYTDTYNALNATQFYISESCKPLAVRYFVARRAACTCSLALLTIFSDISCLRYAIWQPASWVAKFIQSVTNIFIFHLTQNFRHATQGVSYNLTKSRQQNHSPAYCSNSGPRPRHSSPKCGWRHKNDFYSDGKCPLDGTWCQRNNCQSSHKGEITPEETDR